MAANDDPGDGAARVTRRPGETSAIQVGARADAESPNPHRGRKEEKKSVEGKDKGNGAILERRFEGHETRIDQEPMAHGRQLGSLPHGRGSVNSNPSNGVSND